MDMRILITGASGLLGSSLTEKLRSENFNVVATDIAECNVISYTSVRSNLSKKFDFLINCVAYTDVPQAEVDKRAAYYLNAQSCGILARVCADNNTHLIHFGTDFIFDGKKESPYIEEDAPNPLNYYGTSKLNGENVLKKNMDNYTIFRLQWLFGQSNKTFFSKILERSKTSDTLKIVDDEIGSPCSVDFISEVICKYLLLESRRPGETYHLTHNNFCSRYECAKYFLNKTNWAGNLIPISSSEVSDGISRPKFGAMNNSKLSKNLAVDLGSWESDIDNFIDRNSIC